jgi:hypothetical protein
MVDGAKGPLPGKKSKISRCDKSQGLAEAVRFKFRPGIGCADQYLVSSHQLHAVMRRSY